MKLVNLAPGITVNPEKIDFVLVQTCQPRDGTGYLASLIYDRLPVVSLRFDTPAEAEQCVDEWTAKLNEAKLGTRVPTLETLDAKADGTANEIINVMRNADMSVESGIENMASEEYQELFGLLVSIIRRHHRGTS